MNHRISSPYHPQTNGLDERTNQTLVRTLNKLAETQSNCDQHIDSALYAYRVSKHDSSKFSPFFLMYNRHPRMAVDHEMGTMVESNEDTASQADFEKTLQHLLQLREHYHSKALGNIGKAQERQKAYYDSKHDSHKVNRICC